MTLGSRCEETSMGPETLSGPRRAETARPRFAGRLPGPRKAGRLGAPGARYLQ